MVKAIIDSSTLISLSESCLFNLFKHLKEKNNIEFLISESVKAESVTRPLSINRFKLSAIRIKQGLTQGAITVVPDNKELNKLCLDIEDLAANILNMQNQKLKMIHHGEIEALALAKYTGANILVIDEKITRMLLENPFELKRLIEKRQLIKVMLNKKRHAQLIGFLPKLGIIRSSELVALAFEQGLLGKELSNGRQMLEAALYALKFSGCALSEYEINDYVRQARIIR